MRWRFPLMSEVVDRSHQARTEEMMPYAVHRDSSRQWIAGVDEPLRQLQSPALGRRRSERRTRVEDLDKATQYHFTRPPKVSSLENPGVCDDLAVRHRHGHRRFGHRFFTELFD